MIRPFDLRDIRLVLKLEHQGIALDSRTALIGLHRPFRGAMLAYLIAGRGTPTLVLRQAGRSGTSARLAFGQIRVSTGCTQARMVTLAIGPGEQSAIWPMMLDGLTVQAGRHGAHMLIAEVAVGDIAFEALRRADFVVYTRQEVWRQDAFPTDVENTYLRQAQADDLWQVQQLVANTVPQLIQQIEPPSQTRPALVWEQDGNPLCCIAAQRGPRGIWAQLYLHPQAEEDISAIIREAMVYYRPSADVPLFLCVRRYQEWLTGSLVEAGFQAVGSQAIMVRHTTARWAGRERMLVTGREQALEVTSPIARIQEK